MNVYAVSWVMGSPVDSHVKALFAQNPSLSLVGFIFPETWIPTLDGVPIYSFSNAPINRNGIYVDFSLAQKLSREAVAWSNANEVEVISLAAWLNLLATGTESINSFPLLDGIPLKLVKELKIDRRSIDRLNPASQKNAVDILDAYQKLNFRDLHKKSKNIPNEEYIQEVVRLFTRNMRGAASTSMSTILMKLRCSSAKFLHSEKCSV